MDEGVIGFSLRAYCRKRPYLYHTANAGNLPLIRKAMALRPAADFNRASNSPRTNETAIFVLIGQGNDDEIYKRLDRKAGGEVC